MIRIAVIGLGWWEKQIALDGRAPYRFTIDELLANIRILDAVMQSTAAGGKPAAL